MATSLLKYALNKHFTERGRAVLKEEVDKLIVDWCDVIKSSQHIDDANFAQSRIAVLSKLKVALNEPIGDGIAAETFCVRTEVATSYLPSEDVTVIWKYMYIDDECLTRTIVGFYHGEPDDKATEMFSSQPLTAEYL